MTNSSESSVKIPPERAVLIKAHTIATLLDNNRELLVEYINKQEPMYAVSLKLEYSFGWNNETGLGWINLAQAKMSSKLRPNKPRSKYDIAVNKNNDDWTFVDHTFYTNSSKEHTLVFKYRGGQLTKDYSYKLVHHKQATPPPPSPTEVIQSKGNLKKVVKLLNAKEKAINALLKRARKNFAI